MVYTCLSFLLGIFDSGLYTFVVSLLEGIDLEQYDFLAPLVVGIIIVLCLGVTFRALLTIFNTFFRR